MYNRPEHKVMGIVIGVGIVSLILGGILSAFWWAFDWLAKAAGWV